MTIPSGYAQVNLIFGGAGLPFGAQATCGFNITSFVGSPIALAELVGESFGTEVVPSCSSSVTLVGALAKFGPDATGPSALFPLSFTGAENAGMVPPNTGFLIRKSTAAGGRRNRGRMYVPGVSEVNVGSTGDLTTPIVTQMQTGFNDWQTTCETDGAIPVVLHQDFVGAPTTILDFVVQTRVGTQRRRLRP